MLKERHNKPIRILPVKPNPKKEIRYAYNMKEQYIQNKIKKMERILREKY